jgi:hypothetical protein
MAMKAKEIETAANGLEEERDVLRLDPGEREQAVNDFVWYMLGDDVDGETFDCYAADCEVHYRDDYDTGESWYQVVNKYGHGDGSGEWTKVS